MATPRQGQRPPDTAPRRPAASVLPGGDARPCGKPRSHSGEGRGASGVRHQLAVGEREAAVCFGNFTSSHNETGERPCCGEQV